MSVFTPPSARLRQLLRPARPALADEIRHAAPFQTQHGRQLAVQLVLGPLEIALVHLAHLLAVAQGPRPLAAHVVDHGGQLAALAAHHHLMIEILGSADARLLRLAGRQRRDGRDQRQRLLPGDNRAHQHSRVHRCHHRTAAVQGRQVIVKPCPVVIGQAGRSDALHPTNAHTAVHYQITCCKHLVTLLTQNTVHTVLRRGPLSLSSPLRPFFCMIIPHFVEKW